MNDQKETELVTINGIQVQKYQWECIEELARLDKYDDPIKWLHDYILLNILIPRLESVSENYDSYPVAVLKKLSKDGYGRKDHV